MRRSLVAGVFVGGAASRMGGRAKGLLRAPDGGEALVDRWRRLFEELGVPCVLVGARAEYAPRPAIADAEVEAGPLGGLVSLLRHAGGGDAIAVACDMPHVSLGLLRRLAEAPDAIAVAPRRDGRWEPLFARYRSRALPIAERRLREGARSLQGLLDELRAEALPLSRDEAAQLRDWDTVEDMERDS